MPHHKACAKHMRASVKRRAANRSGRSALRTALRKVRLAKGRAEGQAALRSAYAAIDKGAKTGLIHKNTAANKKSRLSKFVASLPE